MLSNDHVSYKPPRPRPGKANNLPGSRAPKPGWNTPTMKAAKLIACAAAVHRAGNPDRLATNREWAKLGITAKALHATVCRLVPGFEAEFKASGRKSDPAQALFNRVFYMFRERNAQGVIQAKISFEYPTNSDRLRPYYERARQVYHSNRPMTLGQVRKWFS